MKYKPKEYYCFLLYKTSLLHFQNSLDYIYRHYFYLNHHKTHLGLVYHSHKRVNKLISEILNIHILFLLYNSHYNHQYLPNPHHHIILLQQQSHQNK